MKRMQVIHNVTIKPTTNKTTFQVTWHDTETGMTKSFEQTADITPHETEKLWQMTQFQTCISRKLFRFLDGDTHLF